MTAAYSLPPVVEPPTCCGDGGECSTPTESPAGNATVDAADALFKGFADPTRLRILNVLAAGELCVCDIVELLDVAQPAVSRHLAYLRRTGLVTATRDGKFAHYQLAPARDAVHQSLMACVVGCFRGIPSLDAERAAAVRRVTDRHIVPC
jgi:ArsR family transcriptional regulator